MSKIPKGLCNHCKKTISLRSALKHIEECVEQTAKEDAFLIKTQWPHKSPQYFMYLSVPFTSTLEDLDKLLRDTWLECCSHLSRFVIGNLYFTSDFEYNLFSNGQEYSMKISCEDIFGKVKKVIHEYDYGSTTELLLEVVGHVKCNSKEITILMRNENPIIICSHCEEKATLVQNECDYLCDNCMADYGDDFFVLPITNSPRSGICGYVG